MSDLNAIVAPGGEQSSATENVTALTGLPSESAPTKPSSIRSSLAFAFILLAGLAIRAWIVAIPGVGHLSDMDFFRDWSRGLAQRGLGGFYESNSFCDYPPIWLLVMWGMGKLAAMLDPTASSDLIIRALLKAPACLADVAIAIVLFVQGRRMFGPSRACAAAALYLLNPITFYSSAYWGQVDSIHSLLCLGALVLAWRGRCLSAGGFAALAMLQKFQSVALVPLVILEIFRRGRFRATAMALVGAAAATAVIAAPFALTGVMDDVFHRAYVRVIGQYTDMSRSAFNLWWLAGDPEASDIAVPRSVLLAAAEGRTSFPDAGSWHLGVTWRRISLAIYSLVVAIILSLYARIPSQVHYYAAAGLLALAFFLFPTEMHERYALPAFALLPLWAVGGPWRERSFFLLSIMLMLNVAEFLPPRGIAGPIAGANLVLFVGVLLWFFVPAATAAAPQQNTPAPDEVAIRGSWVIRLFQWMTLLAIPAAAAAAAGLIYVSRAAPAIAVPHGVTWLSDLTPIQATQGWKELQRNRSVGGGPIHLGETYYVFGLGTHAPSRLTYAIPPHTAQFEAIVGINRATGGKGSILAAVDVDGKEVFTSPSLTGESDPVPVRVDVRGAKLVTLRVEPTADGQRADHADWADARFIAAGVEPPSTAPHPP